MDDPAGMVGSSWRVLRCHVVSAADIVVAAIRVVDAAEWPVGHQRTGPHKQWRIPAGKFGQLGVGERDTPNGGFGHGS